MSKHRSYPIEFKRQVAQEYLAGETFHGLAKRHEISRNLVRIWVAKYEAGSLDSDVVAADIVQAQEARIGALVSGPMVITRRVRHAATPTRTNQLVQMVRANLGSPEASSLRLHAIGRKHPQQRTVPSRERGLWNVERGTQPKVVW